MAQHAIDVRHRQGRRPCKAKGKDPRNCICSPSVRVQVNYTWQDDLKGVLPRGWAGGDLAELEAEAQRRALDHDSGRKLVERGVAPLMRDVAEEFLADLRRERALGEAAHNTVVTYTSLWNVLLDPAFGDLRVTAITRELVAETRMTWLEAGRSRNYVMNATALLSTILSEKAVPRWRTDNPCHSIGRRKRRKQTAERKPRALATPFVFELLDKARELDLLLLHDMVLCAVTTGMRQREVAGLRPEYVHLRDNRIEVVGQYIRSREFDSTKNGHERTTVICDLLGARLRERMQTCGEYVFGAPASARYPHLDGCPWAANIQNENLRKLWDATGPRTRGEGWHALRHTFSTVLDRHRIRPLVSDAVMGHKNSGVAYRYRHVMDEELNAIVVALNTEFDRTPPEVTRLDERRRLRAVG